jgi:hypothetical protein
VSIRSVSSFKSDPKIVLIGASKEGRTLKMKIKNIIVSLVAIHQYLLVIRNEYGIQRVKYIRLQEKMKRGRRSSQKKGRMNF